MLDRHDDIASYVSMRLLQQCIAANEHDSTMYVHDISPLCKEDQVPPLRPAPKPTVPYMIFFTLNINIFVY